MLQWSINSIFWVGTHFKPGDNIPLREFSEDQAEISIHQVVYVLRAMDSRDIAQLRVNRRVEAHKPRDDTTLSCKYLSSSATTRRLIVVEEEKKQGVGTDSPTNVATFVGRQWWDYEIVGTTVTRRLAFNLSILARNLLLTV